MGEITAKYKVLLQGVKTDSEDDPEITTNMDVEAVGVYTNGEWVTFHNTFDNGTDNVEAAFPTRRVIVIQRDNS